MKKSQTHKSASREIPIKVGSEFSYTDEQLRQRIAEKAYELYRGRGCVCGGDLDDWLEAERSILSEIELQSRGAAQSAPGQSQRSTKR